MIKYTLTKPLKYGNKQLSSIELHAPTVMHLPLLSKIKEGYNMAQLDYMKRLKESGINLLDNASSTSEKKEEVSDDDMAEGVRDILQIACVGTSQIYENMKALFLSDGICCPFEGEETFKKLEVGHLNKININDFISMVAIYLGAFIIPAL